MYDYYQKKFFRALEDVFVGAKIEGDSGFTNLMSFKSRYYRDIVFPQLRDEIIEATHTFSYKFQEELYQKLYTFFSRYFSPSGSLYFIHTPLYRSVYDQIYTDDRDVILFYKTHMLYYVKTDRLFRSLEIELESYRFRFDVSQMEHKKANEKRGLVYTLQEVDADERTITLAVTYSERGRKTKIDNVLRACRKKRLRLDEETLQRAFRLFERQSEVDYFINKDAGAFLREQFDLWFYQYVFRGESEWDETRIRQLQIIRRIANRLIGFIADFEDELVRVWNKPRFVRRAHYIITLERIAGRPGGDQWLTRFLAHPGLSDQIAEWQELGMVDEDFTPDQLLTAEGQPTDACRFLPLDTRHTPDLELSLLALFDSLDEELDGWLIHSENYQALNSLRPRFRGRIKCIYIDPPYNTTNDDFIYNDRFRHSSWLTMMENRLWLAREWLREDGAIFVSVDDNEHAEAWKLMESLFGAENAITSLVWEGGLKNDSRFISVSQDYIIAFVKNKVHLTEKGEVWRSRKEGIDDIYRQVERLQKRYGDDYDKISAELQQWYRTLPKGHPAKAHRHYNMVDEHGVFFPGDISWPGGGGPTYNVFHPLTGKPVVKPARGWVFPTAERMKQAIQENRVYFGPDETSVPKLKRYLHKTEGQVLAPVFYKDRRAAFQHLRDILGHDRYRNPKDVGILSKLFEATTGQDSLIFDFFAGSGTTAHAVINLNRADGGRRKYILVEMADYFHTVLLPRIKKVVFRERWKAGKPAGGAGISHFVKYYRLEQYEETLKKARYRDDADLFHNIHQDPYHHFVFLRNLRMLNALDVDEEANTVEVHLERLYPDIDLPETLANLRGKWIKRIHPDPDDPSQPGRVEFADGETIALDPKNLDYRLVKPLIWWG